MTNDEQLLGWPMDRHLAFDIAYALPRSHVRGIRRAFTEDERRDIAKSVVEHLMRCGWRFSLPPPIMGHGTGKGGS